MFDVCVFYIPSCTEASNSRICSESVSADRFLPILVSYFFPSVHPPLSETIFCSKSPSRTLKVLCSRENATFTGRPVGRGRPRGEDTNFLRNGALKLVGLGLNLSSPPSRVLNSAEHDKSMTDVMNVIQILNLRGVQCYNCVEKEHLVDRLVETLVAQCSAIGVSGAATPPCSATRFCKEHLLRHSDRGVAR